MSNSGLIPLIELHYFPSLDWFAVIARHGKVCLEAKEHYTRQSYRNRCRILGPNKVQALSVPIMKTAHKIPIREVRVEPDIRWRNNHWRSIMSGYGKSPFFEHYEQRVRDLIYSGDHYLFDLNLRILSECLDMTGLDIIVEQSAEFMHSTEKTGFLDLRNTINPKKPVSASLEIKSVRYLQAFGQEFVTNLSILDLIFNEGPNAGSILKAMTKG